jgi:diaminopimelate decarboxylase
MNASPPDSTTPQSAAPENGPPLMDEGERRRFVERFLDRRAEFLAVAAQHGSPLYLIDPGALRQRAREYLAAFRTHLPNVRVYYALKSNSHPQVLRYLLAEGLGADVSSGLELTAALEAGAGDIIFSGPGKTDGELDLAVAHAGHVRVLLDSFAELERLDAAAARAGLGAPASGAMRVRAGVRLTTDERGLWRKFGIPLSELGRFWEAAALRARVRLEGVQFHTSWNLGPAQQVAFLERLGEALAHLSPDVRRQIEFVDAGGGFWPPAGEWIHRPDGAPLREADLAGLVGSRLLPHHVRPAAPIAEFAAALAEAFNRAIRPHADARLCVEPGRWLCHEGLHILLTVVDRKASDLVITDAGTNAIGWERYEMDYFPVINLSRPDPAEHPCMVLGSLCTPHDVWGLAYCGSDIAPGDVLLLPCQGAYTYSLRQEFIKPLPRTAVLAGSPA